MPEFANAADGVPLAFERHGAEGPADRAGAWLRLQPGAELEIHRLVSAA